MRIVCSKAEVDTLISQMNSGELKWIDDDTERKEKYDDIIKSGDKRRIIMLLRTIYLRRKELAQSGKKLRSYDESLLKTAENMVFEEFAYALGIDRLEVGKYIEEHIA